MSNTTYKYKDKTINIDLSRDALLSDAGIAMMKDRYLLKEYNQQLKKWINVETSPQECFARSACEFGSNQEHAQRLYDYASKNWMMFSTPILSNAGTYKGLPISCFLNYVDDSVKGILDHHYENGFLSSYGGGIGGDWSHVRASGSRTSRGNVSTGVIAFIRMMDSQMLAFQQGSCYLPGTEVLTNNGFKDFRDLQKTDLVAQVNEHRQITFTSNFEITENHYSGDLFHISGPTNSVNLIVTPNHSMVIERVKRVDKRKSWSGKLEKVTAENVKYHRGVQHHKAGWLNTNNQVAALTTLERLKIAYQADGAKDYTTQDGITTYAFHFKKDRKIKRLTEILQESNYDYVIGLPTADASVNIYVRLPEGTLTKDFNWIDLSTKSFKWYEEFINELVNWDGHKSKTGISFSTINKQVSDKVQEICSLCNKRSNVKVYDREGNRQFIYQHHITDVYRPVQGASITKEVIKNYSGKVYCCIVPDGMLVVRKDLSVSICGNTRRGSYAAYMDVTHPEIEEFIDIRTPHGADLNRRCLGTGFHHAINISDAFMEAVEKGTTWSLIDPATKEVHKVVDARTLWMKILTKRVELGEPYLHFIDTSNKALPQFLKDKGLRINSSNLCSEIFLPTSPDRTAVCCLSSVNFEYFDTWSLVPEFIPDMMEMLDNVLEQFIESAPKEMWRAVNSAKNSRDVGLGTMGYYLYLQKRGIPFETPMALGLNKKLFEFVHTKALEANLKLGSERGEAPDAIGTGRRFSHMMAVAPNANNSVICGGTSPSIEPYNANIFKQNTLSGSFTIKNKLLAKLLKEEYKLAGEELEEVWSSISVNGGSVQHLNFLSDEHKALFKTAMELDQKWIIEHAAFRQPFICQGQSVNVYLPPDIHKNELHQIHFQAWKKGLKALYYSRSAPIRKTEIISKPSREEGEREVPMDYVSSGCLACEG